MSKDEIKQLAVDGAIMLKEVAQKDGGNFAFEYSPKKVLQAQK